MKLTRLRLKNFGVFYGNFDFDLNPHQNGKNVILVGGKNGSGKTTILEAIRLALYGPLAYGFKVDTSVYYDKVDSKLNSYARRNKETTYQIILDIELVENLERKSYIIRRSWGMIKNTIKEEIMIQCNDSILSDKDLENFQTRLREEMPPQLMELFLFDGEKISQVLSDGSFSLYLKESARVMFNLDLFEHLDTDLNNYLKSDSVFSNLTKDEQRYFQAKEEKEACISKRHLLLQEIDQVNCVHEETNAQLSELNKQFEVHGGLQKEQRDILFNQMKEIDNQRLNMMEKNKEIISSVLPFMLVRDLLKDVTKQMELESVDETKNNIMRVIDSNKITKLLESLVDRKLITTNREVEQVAEEFFTGFMEICSTSESTLLIHNSSYQQRAEVESLYRNINEFAPESILDNLKQNTILLKQVQKIRKKIDENDSTNDLKEILIKMQFLKNEINNLAFNKEQLLISIADSDNEIDSQEKEFEVLSNKFMQSKKIKSVVSIIERVTIISKSFRKLQTQKKLQQVEIETAHMLNQLFRKELFVVRVFIHPETFTLKLFNDSGEEINKDILSAGEKEILLLSTIWAMSTCSKRRLPFVFDTLLGRLDQTHKKSIIDHFIPNCGEQVIILCTDSEIDSEHFRYIEPVVSKTYTIDYNSNKTTVQVSESYFNNILSEVNKLELPS